MYTDKHKLKRMIFMILFLSTMMYAYDIFEARVYVEGSDRSDLAYIHTNKIEQVGDSTIITHFYHTPDGSLYARDEVILLNDKTYRNILEFFEIDELGQMQCKGDQVEMIYINNGKEKRATRNIREPLVCAPLQDKMIREYFENILRGEEVHFYVFAAEMLRLVDMKVQLIEGSPYERPGTLVVQMKPKSMLISWLVGNTYYVVDPETKRLLEMHGFSTLRQNIDGKWEYVNMDFYYTYK